MTRDARPAGAGGGGPVEERRVARGSVAFGYTFAARGIRAGGRILAFAVAARLYGMSDVGELAYLIAVGALVGCLADLGLSEYAGREYPASGFRADRLLWRAAQVRLLGTAPALSLGLLAVAALRWESLSVAAIGSIAYGLAGSTGDFLASMHRAQGHYQKESLDVGLGILAPVVVAAGIAVAIPASGFAGFQLVLGGSALAFTSARLVGLMGHARRRWDGSEPAIALADAVVRGRWFLAKALVTWAIFESPVIVIEHLADLEEIAVFAAAMRPAGLLTQPFIALAWVFVPVLAHDLHVGRDRLAARVVELNTIMLASVPGALAGCLLVGYLMLRLFGDAYLAAWPTLVVLAAAQSVYLGILNGIPVVTIGRERAFVISQAVALVALLVALIALVPRLGALGAAWAMMIGLAASKVPLAVLYRSARLTIVGWKIGAVLAAVAVWFALVLVAGGATGLVLLVAGGLVSALATWRLLRRAVLFAREPSVGQ
jgi:O-antigen/teichoic acid export membrane protein